MIKLTFIQILFYFRSCRPCHPHWRSADAVLFFSFLSPQDCGDLQPTAPRWDGRRVPALRRSRRGRWSRLTLCFDLQFRRGWPNRSPWLSPRPCSPPGWVWSSRPRTCSILWDWTRSPPVALPSYPPADWLLCFWSNRIFPAASGTVAVNVVFLRRPWLALLAALFHCRRTSSFSSLFICISIASVLPFDLLLCGFIL